MEAWSFGGGKQQLIVVVGFISHSFPVSTTGVEVQCGSTESSMSL